jgi:hypothetical protein
MVTSLMPTESEPAVLHWLWIYIRYVVAQHVDSLLINHINLKAAIVEFSVLSSTGMFD